MKVKDIAAILEEYAPLALQESYDNAGLIVGHPDTEITGTIVCVDVTEKILDEAIAAGANLVLAHHPVIFLPLRAITGQSNVERIVNKALCNNVAIYACHTNLDRASHGMGYAVARQLGLQNIEVLDSMGMCDGTGFGAIGMLPGQMDTMDFLRMAKERLGTGCVRYSAPCRDTVQRIALINGSGGDGLDKAIAAGADVFLTADVRHDRFLAAEGRILLADVGHFESEFCVRELICDIIRKKIPTFVVAPSASETNPVNYLT